MYDDQNEDQSHFSSLVLHVFCLVSKTGKLPNGMYPYNHDFIGNNFGKYQINRYVIFDCLVGLVDASMTTEQEVLGSIPGWAVSLGFSIRNFSIAVTES